MWTNMVVITSHYWLRSSCNILEDIHGYRVGYVDGFDNFIDMSCINMRGVRPLCVIN